MNFNKVTVLALKAQLEENGYANDEQFLGSFAFEHRRDEIFSDLREVDYSQKLGHAGAFFESIGALYWYYDPDMNSREDALKLSEKWARDASEKGSEIEF